MGHDEAGTKYTDEGSEMLKEYYYNKGLPRKGQRTIIHPYFEQG